MPTKEKKRLYFYAPVSLTSQTSKELVILTHEINFTYSIELKQTQQPNQYQMIRWDLSVMSAKQ